MSNTINMNFEKGLMANFRSTFSGVAISGCEYHWESFL
jgi:hypothetical protein